MRESSRIPHSFLQDLAKKYLSDLPPLLLDASVKMTYDLAQLTSHWSNEGLESLRSKPPPTLSPVLMTYRQWVRNMDGSKSDSVKSLEIRTVLLRGWDRQLEASLVAFQGPDTALVLLAPTGLPEPEMSA
jgi:hypothetical protein